MPGPSDFAFLEVDGVRLETWTSYRVASNLLEPADAFDFEVAIGGVRDDANIRGWRELHRLLSPGNAVKLYVGDDVTGRNRDRYLQLTGIIDERTTGVTRDGGTAIAISGRDLAAHLVDSSVPLDLVRAGQTLLTDLVKAAVEPYGIPVITDSAAARDILSGARADDIERARQAGVMAQRYSRRLNAEADRRGVGVDDLANQGIDAAALAGLQESELAQRAARAQARARRLYANAMAPGDVARLTLDEARPNPGETIWEFLDRHARRLGVMLWFAPNGKLIVSAPNYGTRPRHRLVRRFISHPDDPNNILAGTVSDNAADRYSAVTVYGKAPRGNAARAKIQATVADEEWEADFDRVLIVHDNEITTVEAATKRAERELSTHRTNRQVLSYTVADHGAAGYLYAVDTMVEVEDEVADVSGRYYVVGRTFEKSRDTGTQTRLKLLPPESIVL